MSVATFLVLTSFILVRGFPPVPPDARTRQVWKPTLQFETFSYLPALSDDDIKKQIGYMLRKGLTPCLEFDCAERSFAKEQPAYGPGFYYNRYWMMWKLPMFGCTDGDQVLKEVANCKKDYPDHYIRVVGFNAEKQVQMASFIVHKPN